MTRRASNILAAVFAFTAFTGIAHAQVGGATDQSTHIGGSTGTGQTGSDAGGPIAPSGMHAPTGPTMGGSVGTGKTGSGPASPNG